MNRKSIKPKPKQIKTIEIELFSMIDQYEASKDYKLIDKINVLQKTYSTFNV